MKKYFALALLVALNLKAIGQYKAPNDKNPNIAAPIAAGVIGGVGALITAGIIYDRYIELLELDATELYLRSGQASKAFKLQLMPFQVNSFKDLSNTTILAFGITELIVNQKDRVINKSQNKLLLLYLHDGWISEGGINFAFVTTEILNYDDWKKIYHAYLNISITDPILDPDLITAYEKVSQKTFDSYAGEKKQLYNSNTGSTSFYVKSDQTVDLRGPFLHTDRALFFPRGSFEDEYLLISPTINILDDEYVTTKLDDETLVLFNEGMLGLYKTTFNRLVQLSNKAVTDINTFLVPRNKPPQPQGLGGTIVRHLQVLSKTNQK